MDEMPIPRQTNRIFVPFANFEADHDTVVLTKCRYMAVRT